jgi:mono/diheme cytochrome c family protein
MRSLLLLAMVAGVGLGQEKSPRKMPMTLDGKELFVAYCASCHGMDGKGKGPVAAALKNGAPDLSTLTKRKQGKFPTAELEKLILGDGMTAAAHGSREMPVWGPVFRRVENDRDLGLVRVRRVVEFVETLQVK